MIQGSPSQNNPLPYGNTGEWSGITGSGIGKFPNPFFDIASEYVPRNLLQIFEWSEYIYLTYGTYRSAARKVVRYFLTEVVLDGESESEREDIQEFLDNDLHLLSRLAEIGDDYMVYGNVPVSIYFPFDRFLTCKTCGTRYHIDTIGFRFNWRDLSFTAKCLKCGAAGIMDRMDVRSMDKKRVRIKRWNPKRIRLRVHDISGDIEYFYEPDPRFVQKLRDGNRFYLNQTPWELIKCCAGTSDSEQPLFKFDKDSIYHMKEATLAGLPIKGWAIPPLLPNFKLAYYIQILRRYDEAIALDYIIPFRILYPKQQSPAGMNTDPIQMMSMDLFTSKMQGMVAAKRRNSTDIQITPFPVGYEMLGGEAQSLAPKDNIAQAMDELLNAVGFPAELYRGSLNIQAFPVALRLFEKTWGSLVDGYDDLIAWIIHKICRYFGWGTVGASLRSVTLADDIERKALSLQAAAGMDISKRTAYKPLGIDFMEEQEKVLEEQKEIMRLQQEAMEEQEAAQMGGEDPNAQAGPGGAPGATPGDIHQQAKDMAYQLLTQTPETARRGELIKIKHSNPTLHALVMQEMDNIRQEMASQGQTMLMEQAKQASDRSAIGDLPSPMLIGIRIAQQIGEYNRRDLRKMAMAIKRDIPDIRVITSDTPPENIPGSLTGFRFVYRRMLGWE